MLFLSQLPSLLLATETSLTQSRRTLAQMKHLPKCLRRGLCPGLGASRGASHPGGGEPERMKVTHLPDPIFLDTAKRKR